MNNRTLLKEVKPYYTGIIQEKSLSVESKKLVLKMQKMQLQVPLKLSASHSILAH
jgi:hypothetical protein